MSYSQDKRLWMIFFIPVLIVCFAMPGLASKGKVKLAYVEWSSEIASTNLVQAVLQEEMDYRCEIIPMPADEMWQAVAEGEVDGMVSAWLPNTQKEYYEQYSAECVDLGPNLKGARTGLVVPNITLGRQTAATGLRNKPYITAESIADLPKYADKFHHMIVGIDPEAGVMHNTQEAIEAYGLDGFRLIEGNEKKMTRALGRAISKQEWIVVTGWVPHWKFARWELKFLDDPKNVFGGEEHINTVVRQGLKEDMPEVYAFLDNFYWEPEDMGQMMVWIHDDEGMYPYEKALRYIRTHQEQIQSWLP
ncbi:MAG: glycine betaine ABC transporter substrate-binding protein [Desulfovermiculus sp.]|nr:glycine betaine ABC transporter substrate-binding protein [Desulfovermiculus sp.]